MTDIQDRYRERWQDRRKKTYNWKKLVIMILILVALFILIDRLNKVGTITEQPAAEYIEPAPGEQAVPEQNDPPPPTGEER